MFMMALAVMGLMGTSTALKAQERLPEYLQAEKFTLVLYSYQKLFPCWNQCGSTVVENNMVFNLSCVNFSA